MTDYTGFKEIGVSLDGIVATVEMRRPPHNFFDSLLIAEIDLNPVIVHPAGEGLTIVDALIVKK